MTTYYIERLVIKDVWSICAVYTDFIEAIKDLIDRRTKFPNATFRLATR